MTGGRLAGKVALVVGGGSGMATFFWPKSWRPWVKLIEATSELR